MAETKSAMRKLMFIKVDQLRPGINGHNLVVKAVSSKIVLQKGRPYGPQVCQMRIVECLVEDETMTILFTARNEQGIPLRTLESEETFGLFLASVKRSPKRHLSSSGLAEPEQTTKPTSRKTDTYFFRSIKKFIPCKILIRKIIFFE
ncbi:Uncharacterized protein Fot_42023 [Forsythia ovata]|uniref:Single-stranded DNA binding protein Ssb-like OB fold domain-containing protein n=1 Tax=Forsythia ovata TaxID=205694 RepID=A0ABD1RKQ9_9LAMI